jgi:hypothetical protein
MMKDNVTEALKPCPWCNEAPREEDVGDWRGELWGVFCENKKCPSHMDFTHETKAEAITAWNTRTQDSELAEARAEIERLRSSPPAQDDVTKVVEACARIAEGFAEHKRQNPDDALVCGLTATDIAGAIRRHGGAYLNSGESDEQTQEDFDRDQDAFIMPDGMP